jgi:cytidine deaminase
MNKNEITTKHVCNEELVSDFIDNRMNEKEKKEYIRKIDDCVSIRKCVHCKQLIIEFLSLKKNIFHLQNGFTMPKNIENNLMSRIRSSFQETKKKN